ncbi:MAG TPA: hypothetical protein VFC31_10450 [Candidatus Limnocylindria bacterium]|nr:hypothetical protein [Candidatus Limnocylindria bacterium]
MRDRRSLGIASILVALGPIAFIAIFGSWASAGLSQTDSADPTIAIPFLRAHPAMVVPPTLDSIVMHVSAIVLAIGLHRVLSSRAHLLASIGAACGVMWGVLDISQSLVLYNAVLAAPKADAATIDIVTKGLQNAAHLGGGLWTLSIAATAAGLFGRAHRAFGVLTGAIFALHPLIVPAIPAYFYLEFVLLPLWFAWTGIAVLRTPVARMITSTAAA